MRMDTSSISEPPSSTRIDGWSERAFNTSQIARRRADCDRRPGVNLAQHAAQAAPAANDVAQMVCNPDTIQGVVVGARTLVDNFGTVSTFVQQAGQTVLSLAPSAP